MDELTVRPNTSDPSRKWRVGYLAQAVKEGKKTLNDVQYAYAVEQMLALADEDDPSHPVLGDVKAVENFHELRMKGGVLGKINLRIFFLICVDARMVVVLGVWNKGAEDQTPVRILVRIRGRRRRAEELARTMLAPASQRVFADKRKS